MYMARQSYGAARARYQKVDLASRIEAASPHRLVAILLGYCTLTQLVKGWYIRRFRAWL